jgi:hypothetical protein
MMPQGIDLIPVGSAGHKASSGDMDLMVDEEAMLNYSSKLRQPKKQDKD